MREYSKTDGYLSPPMGIKLSEGPDRLIAFSKVPLAGWLQIVAFCGLIEYTGSTFAQRKSIGRITAKLNALFASGRRAMVAIDVLPGRPHRLRVGD